MEAGVIAAICVEANANTCALFWKAADVVSSVYADNCAVTREGTFADVIPPRLDNAAAAVVAPVPPPEIANGEAEVSADCALSAAKAAVALVDPVPPLATGTTGNLAVPSVPLVISEALSVFTCETSHFLVVPLWTRTSVSVSATVDAEVKSVILGIINSW
jgi:hypothetical protein